MIWFTQYSLEQLNEVAKQRGLVKTFNISICEVTHEYLCAKMPVTADLLQVHGIMHGGATCVLVETAGSFASRMCLDPAMQYSVGSQIQVNHLRQVKEGETVIAKCKPVHLGKQKHVWDIPVYCENTGKLIAKGELTCAVLNII